MKRFTQMAALLLTVLLLCICPAWQTLAESASAGSLTAYSNEEGDGLQLTYTDARSDYPNLSDAAFVNFRMIATTGMGEGALYRTASPIDPTHKRNAYADAALKMAGVTTVMNLTDTPAAAEGYDGVAESYYATTDTIALGMEMSFDTEEFEDKLAEGLRFFAAHEGPYAVNCQDGMDRTGVVAALLECFMGATFDEVRKDYMSSFFNYYGIEPGDAVYDQIADNNIAATLQKLFELEDLNSVDLAEAAENYLFKIGLGKDETERLRSNLGKSYFEDTSKYANMENWAYFGVGEGKDADIFIVAPTVGAYEDYNMPLDDKNRFRVTRSLNMQKGIYEGSLRMYAPFYAQASLEAYELSEEALEPWLEIAYDDVSEAFRYYLEHENRGRPIVLFGYSQGGDHVFRLLEEYFGDEALYNRLIAVYAIGWGWSYEAAEKVPQVVPATGEDDIGCVISYDAEAPEVDDTIVTPRGERHFAINPLNWRTDATPADKTQNKGSVFVRNSLKATEVPQLCGAYIDPTRGALKVTDVDPTEYNLRPDVFPEGAYHIYDLNFFWNNLKENIEVRMAAYQKGNKG